MDILPADLHQTISGFLLGIECEILALFTANYYIKTINHLDGTLTYKNYQLYSYDDLPSLSCKAFVEYQRYEVPHREDLPSYYSYISKSYVFALNGQLHNEYGPALVNCGHHEQFFVGGIKMQPYSIWYNGLPHDNYIGKF